MICDKCGYSLSAFDTVCPRCQGKGSSSKSTQALPAQVIEPQPASVVPPAVVAPVAVAPAAAAKPNAVLWGCFILLFVFVVMPISCMTMFGSGGKIDNRGAAYYLAKESITRQLKAPATAKFPNSYDSDVRIIKSGSSYVIHSYVDSQNGFGALIRTRWMAEAEESADGKDVTLKSAVLIE